MFYELFNIIAPVMACIALGVAWQRTGAEYQTTFVMHAVMNIGAPCLVISAFNNNPVELGAFTTVSWVAIILLLLNGLLALPFARYARGDTAALAAPVMFPNWGNMGLPLCLFAFGQEGLSLGLAFFLVGLIAHMLIGFPIFMRSPEGFGSQLKGLARQPVIYAVVLSLFMLILGFELPLWIAKTTELLAGITIPLMLITLGVSLAAFTEPRWLLSLGFSLLRIAGGLALALLVCRVLDITGLARRVILLQSIMPAAVFNYLLAAYFDRDPKLTAGVVVVSTMLSFLAVPLLLMYLMEV